MGKSLAAVNQQSYFHLCIIKYPFLPKGLSSSTKKEFPLCVILKCTNFRIEINDYLKKIL